MKELNPQIGRLHITARSEPLLEGLIALAIQPHPCPSEMIESILNLHKTPAGEQIGMIFKTGALTRVGREPFESVRTLCAKYRRLVDPTWEGSLYSSGRQEPTAGMERQ
jgi:hypothetical protein